MANTTYKVAIASDIQTSKSLKLQSLVTWFVSHVTSLVQGAPHFVFAESQTLAISLQSLRLWPPTFCYMTSKGVMTPSPGATGQKDAIILSFEFHIIFLFCKKLKINSYILICVKENKLVCKQL